MRPLLWSVLVLAVVANALSNLSLFGEVERIVLSAGTGVVAVASVVGLVRTRRRRS